MQATVTITDPDRRVDYILAVACDFLPGSRPRAGWRDGGDPGEGPAVEINSVRCLEVAVWCGKHALSAEPGPDVRESLGARIGAWCLGRYAEEIQEAVLEAFLSRYPAHGESLD